MRDPHPHIVDHHGEVVGRTAVGANDHGIADDIRAEGDVAANDVVEGDVATLGDTKADRRGLSAAEPSRDLVGWEISATAAIFRRESCLRAQA
jgi:hypothetical protein